MLYRHSGLREHLKDYRCLTKHYWQRPLHARTTKQDTQNSLGGGDQLEEEFVGLGALPARCKVGGLKEWALWDEDSVLTVQDRPVGATQMLMR